MKIKQILATSLIAAMLFSLAACGTTAETGGATPSATEAAASEAASGEAVPTVEGYVRKDYSAEPRITVSAIGVAWGNGADPDGVIEQGFEERMNLDLDVTWIPNTEYNDRINVMMVAGDIADVTQILPVNNRAYYPQVIQAIENGVFKDLTPWVLESGFREDNELMAAWPDELFEQLKLNGTLWFLPRGMVDVANMSAFFVRQDIMDETDLTYPTNVDELADFIIALKAAAGDGFHGLQMSVLDFDTNLKCVATAYTGVDDWQITDAGDFVFQSFMPEYKGFLNWVKKLYDAGAIDQEFILDQSANSTFIDGLSIMRVSNWRDWNQSADIPTQVWFSTKCPDKDARVWAFGPVDGPKAKTVSIGTGALYANPAAIRSDFPDEHMDRLLQAFCLYDEEYQWYIQYGNEGTHYTMVDGQPTQVNDEQKEAKSLGYVGGWNQILMGVNPDYVNTKFRRAYSSEEMIAQGLKIQEDSMAAIEAAGLKNHILNLNSPAFAANWADLTKDLMDYRAQYVMGVMSEAEWDAYVADILASPEYQQINEEFKAAAAAA